jgi:DNA-binding transcriptional LysR family regulator
LRDDASLNARRVAVFSRELYASPAYIARRGAPPEPEALLEHDLLPVISRTGEAMPWVLTRGEQRWEGIPSSRATANSPELLMRLVRAGAGITIGTEDFAEPYVKSGELVPVLDDWRLPSVDAWAVFPGRRLMPARTRVFLDAMQAKFSGPECQAIEARVAAGAKAGRMSKPVVAEAKSGD